MKPTDLALNLALGMKEAPPGSAHLVELPMSPLAKNHLGTLHAAAQFALAEAASAARLQHDVGPQVGDVFAVVRGVSLKYRKPATGDLLAFAVLDGATSQQLLDDFATRGRTTATIHVELKDRAGAITFSGSFEWFLGRPERALLLSVLPRRLPGRARAVVAIADRRWCAFLSGQSSLS